MIRIGAVAAVLGGLGWILKGGTIMTGGPSWLEFGLAGVVLFPVALIGLGQHVSLRRPSYSNIPVWLAYAAFVLLFVAAGAGIFADSSGQPPLISQLALLGGALSILGALVALGRRVWQAKIFRSPWRGLPLALGLAAIPLMLVSGLLANLVDERYFEIGIVVMGAGWTALGLVLWSSAKEMAPAVSRGTGTP